MYSKFFVFIILAIVLGCSSTDEEKKIDRKAVVTRHNVMVEGYDSLSSLSVGNGNFAFTTDLTGLQTFYDDYEFGMPLGTQSNWGWHTNPNTENYTWDETLKYFEVEGREVPYRHQLKDDPRANAACNYFRENPHRLHLGMVGFELLKENGDLAAIDDIEKAKHSLNLWTGAVTSEFVFEGQPVKVEVFCHQDKDMISARVNSTLIESGKLSIRLKFPYGVPQNTHSGYDFNSPEKHQSVLVSSTENQALVQRTLDTDSYQVALLWNGSAAFEKTEAHTFKLIPNQGESIEFSCLFAPAIDQNELEVFDAVKKSSISEWENYWMNGGIVDFSGSADERANELERRVVLSQYLTKLQSSGNMPPAETGLTYNSWYGKFHLEMTWWHIAHFAQWQREHLMEEQLDFYNQIFDVAQQTAQDQGYKGVRWPKMIDPSGENSPSSVGSYLIWQQPHIIWFAEQMYQQNPTSETLEKYKKLVFATAEFMADFPVWNETKKQFDLAPPLIPAQEHWSRETTANPPFELAYWYWGLTKAQQWRERLKMDENEDWEHVRLHLAAPDKANGVYLGIEGAVNSYSDMDLMRDHPMVLGAYGILPEWNKIDPEIMRQTMKMIAQRWDWPSTWGWDYPMSAMAAVRLGEPEMALEFLLKDVQKNTYLKNGHNYQSERLRVYLPGNGGLLQTMAMMCAGWEGCKTENPGFPKDGKWNVKWENISPVF